MTAPWFHAWRHGHVRDTASVRIALCSSPNVAKAPCVKEPISVEDAERFAELPLWSAELAQRAVTAFERIGAPTRALARAQRPLERVIVWRRRSLRFKHDRMSVLLAEKVATDAPFERPPDHNQGWTPLQVLETGQRAWDEAVRRGQCVRAYPDGFVGHHVLLHENAIGEPYERLANPFTPLLELFRYRVELISVSSEAIVLAF